MLAFCQPWTVDGGIWHLVYTMVLFSRLLWQSFGGSVALCRRDLNSTCWSMLLRMCENSFWWKDDSWALLPAWALEQSTRHNVYTLAGCQRLTQDVRETTNYTVRCTNEPTIMNDLWRNAFPYDSTTTTRHTSASQLARDPVDAARGRWFLVSLPTIIIRHLTSAFQHVASWFHFPSAILYLPPRITDQLQDSRMLCFCLLLRFYVLVPFPRQ